MRVPFHAKPFDEGTKLKLEIFRRYLREWIPVFLIDSPKTAWCHRINIFDLFCGPGQDAEGTPGSPLIIQEEIKSYCHKNRHMKKEIKINLFFNDDNKMHVEELKGKVTDNRCPEKCCTFHFHSEGVDEVMGKLLSIMKDDGSSNLVFLDQFGVKYVSPESIFQLMSAGTTDLLFFISTSAIRRFAGEPGFKKEYPGERIQSIEYKVVHRYLTQWFQQEVGISNAYFAPFSIKKGSNIYGLIFATMHELGIEKFLRVCWDLDSSTGQANYNIDDDLAWGGQLVLFPDLNVPTKKQVFEKELLEYISLASRTNRDVYRFGLQKGFPSREIKEMLKALQSSGKIKTEFLEDRTLPRKGAFYLMGKTDKIIIMQS
ncbi:MAG: hypothetical protein Kow0089_23490 [Desulfobulbaceae bacterium]